MNIDSILKVIRGIVKLRGASDNTPIGNVSDSLKTNVTASALPSGASTEAKQDTGNSSLSSIDGKVSTEAKQDVGNASLSSIDGKVATQTTLAALEAKASTEAKQDDSITQQTSTNTKLDTLNAKDFATSAKQDTGNVSLSSIDGKVATEAKQDAGNASISSIDAKVSTATLQTESNTRVGPTNEAAAASDTATSGLNGLLKRIAQRLTSTITAVMGNKGATTAYEGTATTTVTNVPSTAGFAISQCLVRALEKNIEVSFDGGTTYLKMEKNDALTWDVKGEITQIKIKTSTATGAYRMLINTEES